MCEDDELHQLRRQNERTAVVNQISILGHIPDQVNYNEFCLPSLREVVDTVHISDVFETEVDDDDVPDEDSTTILQEHTSEISTDISGSDTLQRVLRQLCREFSGIFSPTVREQLANVPPLHYIYDEVMWERSAN